MAQSRFVAAICVPILLTAAAQSSAQSTTGRTLGDGEAGADQLQSKTIYGSDDRIEHYEELTVAEAAVFDATAAMFFLSYGYLTDTGNGYDIYNGYLLNDWVHQLYGAPLCPGEPYADQPAVADCSGFFVGDDLIVTAGHCIENQRDCDNAAFVFGFHMTDPATSVNQVGYGDVYRCSEIVDTVSNNEEDWGLVRVDREIVGRAPLPIRRSGRVEDDPLVNQLAVCGHPSGLPAKYSANAQVRGSHPLYFQSNVDVYAGNSGSPVISLTSDGALHMVEGIVARGNPDFVPSTSSDVLCFESLVCPDEGCNVDPAHPLEEIIRTTTFADFLPTDPFCGDNSCNGDEDCSTCPADCGTCPLCGDDSCNGDEDCSSCPGDCGPCTSCGDGVCQTDESCETCPFDCGPCSADDPQRGDTYHILDGEVLVTLAGRSELVAIDFSEPADIRIVDRLNLPGSPVELYVYDDHAVVLLNNWKDYSAGRIATVDLGNPGRMVLVDEADLPGSIMTSRLMTAGGLAALYVATSRYDYFETDDGEWEYETHTFVSSFEVTSGFLTKQDQVDLGGYVAGLQASPEHLLVAHNDHDGGVSPDRVTAIDIADPSGLMVEGDDVVAEGWINNQFNLDFHNDVLRVVSGSRWGTDRVNWVQTFDASNIHNLTPISTLDFGDGQDLFATRYLGDRLYANTADEDDPFHAIYISDDGHTHEMSEFPVSGWNDFLEPVMADQRLIGIGVTKDGGGTTPAVSLWNVAGVADDVVRSNGLHPLIAQLAVTTRYSWSDARWDHRAFSVLEEAVDVGGPDGGIETGLVLIPFTGRFAGSREYTSAVQIFTFSDESLTRRGTMNHGEPVRRSFQAAGDLTAVLSDSHLRLFDTSDPDEPIELGSTRLPPSRPAGVEITAVCSGDRCEAVEPNQNRAGIVLEGPSVISVESGLFTESTQVLMSYRGRRHDITDVCSFRQRSIGGVHLLDVFFDTNDLPIDRRTRARYRITTHPMPPIPRGTDTSDDIWIETN